MKSLNHLNVFFTLLKAGLWETDVRLLPFSEIDYEKLLQLAEQQSVVGLLTAGISHIIDLKPAKKDVLQFIGLTVQLEQRNQAMNSFIESLDNKMQRAGISSILVKGQGVAQCYERPLWRSSGDVDLLLDYDNYQKAKNFLIPISTSVDDENPANMHLAISFDTWVVELHGTLRSGLGKRIDNEVDAIQADVLNCNRVRLWLNGESVIRLPAPDNDIIFIFTHILQHFFKGGIGLRQICDLCRFIWTYHNQIDWILFATRLKKMGLMSEWKAFASVMVEYLGMPDIYLPLYSSSTRWKFKSSLIVKFILDTGNFGRNRDRSRYRKYSYFVYKGISFYRNTIDSIRLFFIFPIDATRVWCLRLRDGIQQVCKRK